VIGYTYRVNSAKNNSMSDKEKEQKALEIYQQLIRSLEGVTDISEIVSIVNNLIEENGLSPAKRR